MESTKTIAMQVKRYFEKGYSRASDRNFAWKHRKSSAPLAQKCLKKGSLICSKCLAT